MAGARRVAAGLLALAMAACRSAPVTLVALPPAPAPAPTQTRDSGSGTTVLVRDVSLPGYLDSFPVVLARKGSALVVSENAEWAERPPLAVARVLRDALAQRLGPSRVLIAGDGRVPDAELTIEFLALDPQEAALHLDARWFFRCSAAGESRGGRSQLQVAMAGATPAAVAAAMTEALTHFADTLAAEVPCGPSAPNPDRPPAFR